MWLIYALASVFLQGVVNYIDEHLTNNNEVKNTDIHTRIGGLLLISTLMSFIGAFFIWFFTGDILLTRESRYLAMASSIPMVAMYAAYFYLLLSYPVHLVGPLFQISTIWMLVIELIFGGSISNLGLLGIIVLIYGAYILDTGTIKWKIPTKLLLISIPATSTYAFALLLVRMASTGGTGTAITFWQMFFIGVIGVLLFIFSSKYREGFITRIKKQGKSFLGFSFLNETIAEGSFLFANLAVAIAPVGAFVSAMSGVQSVFVLLLFFFFPQGERSKITAMQWFSVILISIGVFLINI